LDASAAEVERTYGPDFFGGIAADESYLFWIKDQNESFTLHRAPRDSSPAVVLTTRQGTSSNLLADGERLFWRELTTNGEALVSLPREGGTPQELLLEADVAGGVTPIVADDAHIYWVESSAAAEQSIVRFPKNGGPKELIVTGIGAAELLGVVDGIVYWWGPETLNSVNLVDGHRMERHAAPVTTTFDREHVYYCDDDPPRSTPAIFKERLAVGPRERLLALDECYGTALLTDGGPFLYVSDREWLRRVPK